jgi:uncharacterized repeat protein (TIGR02543 family)
MKRILNTTLRFTQYCPLTAVLLLTSLAPRAYAAPATVLFQDDFTGGIPGWTAVLPALGNWIDGPMLWQFDKVNNSFSEQSNLYTDASLYSGSRITSMLINATPTPTNFTYSARLTAGDDDGFGLIWGYENESTFYRVYFARQNRALAGWPFQGWGVDRMNNGQFTDLFGPSQSWVNTANRPFDVTITVNNGLLTLTLVDDPLGTAVSYTLVDAQPLPTVPVNAKVGMFQWGMSGGTPRAFRIQNPVLSPTPLTGDPAATVLANWSFLVTPSATNDYPTVVGLWSQALGPSGDMGAMIENSDYTPENVAPSYTNCPSATALAGDVTWSNYVYSARFSSSDNDGFGMLLRYKDKTNWYRIAFRNQSTAAGGIRRGISIQKNVNRTFDQILSSTAFIPPLLSAFDVHAAIRTNQLQVIVVSNPDSATPTFQNFGPYDMAGGIVSGTVDNGKIGVFSWAQYGDNSPTTYPDYGTAVDWVKVREVTGQGLLVSSASGTPYPPVGLNDFPVNTILTVTNDSLVIGGGIRQSCVGWTGIGSVPTSGTTNWMQVTLTNFSVVNWLWLPQYLLTTNATVGGTVTASAGAYLPWVTATSNVTVTATASAGYVFTGWSGDSVSVQPTLTFAMLRPMTLLAIFSQDSDGDSLPDSWELQYFGNLDKGPADDPDGDGLSNLAEYQLGTNPNSKETLAASDGLSSQWVNVQRDPALPSQLRVMDFGSGYRGAWEDSNDNRSGNDFTFIPATNYSDYASFQSPRLVVKSNLWNNAWSTNFSYSAELSVGDNDGDCFYFRYQNESNWFRVTLCGEDPLGNTARPALGLSVQRRLNGFYTNLPLVQVSGPLYAAYTDPSDGAGSPAGFKKVRVTINATNENFEVHVIGWDAFSVPPDFNPSYELVETFTDTTLPTGRIGFGPWGQDGYGNNTNAANGNPIQYGAFFDNIVVKAPAGGTTVFSEDWETVPLYNEFPVGWTNPYTGDASYQGTWSMSAHGTIAQQSNTGSNPTGTLLAPKADVECNILLAPDQVSRNYLLQVGFHPFDDDGIGFVYDFVDTNNYSRVLFDAQSPVAGNIPQGVSISRKSGGIWTDIVTGDPAFIYTNGRPFGIEFANNNGDYRLVAHDLDNPAYAAYWHWTGPVAAANNRFGLTTWFETDAHFLYARAYALPVTAPYVPTPFSITNVTVAGGQVTLSVSKLAFAMYHVLRATNVMGPYLPVATYQTGTQYSEAMPTGAANFYRLQYAP